MGREGFGAMVPLDYLEMVLLPRNGWSYSELERLTIAQRDTLLAMLEYEASVPPPPKVP